MPHLTPLARVGRAMPILVILSLLTLTAQAGGGERSSAPQGASAYIISPADGAVVKSPVRVVFGLRGMGVAPAGVDKANTGHHHLLIDVEDLPSMNMPLPADERHRHFGGGQTEADIELAPGKHRLQLILGDKHHVPHDPVVRSESITITVVDPSAKIDVKVGAGVKLGQ